MTDSKILGTGDAMGGGSRAGPAASTSTDTENAVGYMERTRITVESLLSKSGTANRLKDREFVSRMTRIYAAFGARTADQKAAVMDALCFLFIVHGSSLNVAWVEVDAEPEGCKPLAMSKVVDDIVGRSVLRKFARHFSARGREMASSSVLLQNILRERAVRYGVAPNDFMATIDFLESAGCSPHEMAVRNQVKYGAVGRANGVAAIGSEREARHRTPFSGSQSQHEPQDVFSV